MTIQYPYDQGNPLESPNIYAYAPDQGKAFIDAWRRAREAVLNELPSLPHPNDSENERTEVNVSSALQQVRKKIENDDVVGWNDLDCLLRSFEVSKRIYATYDQNWKPNNKESYKNFELYIQFAELLELAYSRSECLAYLNALIKALDILAAMFRGMSEDQQLRLAYLLLQEKDHVDRLKIIEVNDG